MPKHSGPFPGAGRGPLSAGETVVPSAEVFLRSGDKGRAASEYAKAGQFRRAAEIAALALDEPKLIEYSLRAALGSLPSGWNRLRAPDAARLLVSNGHHRDAISLFEITGDFRKAAETAVAAREPARAAQLFERSRDWGQAAASFEKAGMLQEALQALEKEAGGFRQAHGSKAPGLMHSDNLLRDINLKRAEILVRLGRSLEAAALVQSMPPSREAADFLRRAGRATEAVDMNLELGDVDRAVAAARDAPERDRLLARIYLRTGRATQAGDLLAGLGLAREAAEAYEAGGQWARAAYRWEAAGQPKRAGEAYLKAGRPRDAARCFGGAGDTELAASSLIQAGDTPAAANLLVKTGQLVQAAALHLQAGQRTEAAQILLLVHPAESRFAEGSLLLASLFVEEGLYDDALQRLRQLPPASSEATSSERFYWEARALEGLGRKEEARSFYRRIPGHRDAGPRLESLDWQPAPDIQNAQSIQDIQDIQDVRIAAPMTQAVTLEAQTAPPSTEIRVGQRLAERYDLLALLGHGGMGRVYRAFDREFEEVVAIKTVLSSSAENPEQQERLVREAQIARKISHPNVVRVFDVGRFAGGVFITMELVEGLRLDTLLAREKPLALEKVRWLLGEIAAGLAEAHTLGIVHRDLKPSNVLVTPNRAKILDFGIARMAEGDLRLTRTGLALGSPMYMSPEQILCHELDGRSDLYALGVLAFTLLAGEEPFQGPGPTRVAIQHLQEPPPDIRIAREGGLPEPWAQLVERLLAKAPDARYATAPELLAVLAGLPV